jgi:23S rRNA-/tRNA-specific pseudouridylate synthase
MKKIEILYKDHQLLIINKPSGIAIQSTDNDQLSAIEIMEKKTGGPLFITHRLDQVTSGSVHICEE